VELTVVGRGLLRHLGRWGHLGGLCKRWGAVVRGGMERGGGASGHVGGGRGGRGKVVLNPLEMPTHGGHEQNPKTTSRGVCLVHQVVLVGLARWSSTPWRCQPMEDMSSTPKLRRDGFPCSTREEILVLVGSLWRSSTPWRCQPMEDKTSAPKLRRDGFAWSTRWCWWAWHGDPQPLGDANQRRTRPAPQNQASHPPVVGFMVVITSVPPSSTKSHPKNLPYRPPRWPPWDHPGRDVSPHKRSPSPPRRPPIGGR